MTAPAENPSAGALVSDLPIASGHRMASRLNTWGADARVRDDFENAAAAYEAAQWAIPGNPSPISNLAEIMVHQGRHDEAIAAAELACRIDPEVAEVWYGLGKTLWAAGDPERAIPCFSEALRREQGHVMALHNLAICCLATERFEAGWSAYRWRVTVAHRPDVPRIPIPAGWKGRVHVACEQGLGDVLFFARWLPILREKGAEEIWCAWPTKIAPVMRRAFPGVLEGFGDDGCIDMRMGDLPFLTQTPGPLPSVVVPAAKYRSREDAFRCRAPWVGLTWRAGAPSRRFGLNKRVDPKTLLSVVAGLGGTACPVQRGITNDEIETLHDYPGRSTWDFMLEANEEADDPAEALDSIADLDAYVTVSNTNVHLLAALPEAQRPKCHVLVTHPPEHRWLSAGDSSPWFPGIKVHRQRPDGSWPADMVQRIVEDIRA